MVSAKIQIKVNKSELTKIINQAENLVYEGSEFMAEEMIKSISSGDKIGKRDRNLKPGDDLLVVVYEVEPSSGKIYARTFND